MYVCYLKSWGDPNNIKVDLKEMGYDNMDWIYVVQDSITVLLYRRL
jgi:hypothetical protein